MKCADETKAKTEMGRKIYNYRCYFCHGYSGDAKTVAATYLSPKPRNFTTAKNLDSRTILDALENGRPDSAMKSFASILRLDEREAVADFVLNEFVACGRANTRYHTAANGWPNHAKNNAAAYPFVRGEISVDQPSEDLSAIQRDGLGIFRQACVICHDRVGKKGNNDWQALARLSAFRKADVGIKVKPAPEGEEDEAHSYEYDAAKYKAHDIVPDIANLNDQQQRGRQLYNRDCAYCHAADGTAYNWVGSFLEPHPTEFVEPENMVSLDTSYLKARILEGVPDSSMPSFQGLLSDQDAMAILAYMKRAFFEAPKSATKGQQHDDK